MDSISGSSSDEETKEFFNSKRIYLSEHMDKNECLNFLRKSPVGKKLDYTNWDDEDETLTVEDLIGLKEK